jgi:hypothetical protein
MPETCRVFWQNEFGKLVRLVGFIKTGNNMLEEHTASFFRIGEARWHAVGVFARIRQKVILKQKATMGVSLQISIFASTLCTSDVEQLLHYVIYRR